MPYSKITSSDIANWDSIDEIAESLEKRGLERVEGVSDHEDEIVLAIDDDEFVAVVKADEGKKASDYRTRMDSARHTQVVSTEDFENFTFTSRRRSWDKHGRIQYQKFAFSKEQFQGRGERRSVLEKLNNIEYGDPRTIDQIYETQKVVKKFYDQFEEIKAEMVRNVENIPEDRGDAKQNYAQTIFDRLIFLYFIQEKKLLDYKKDYLRRHHERIADEGDDVYEEFYEPLFFELLSEGAKDTEFGELPYLNGGLFSKTRIEEEFPEARLGSSVEETNELFEEILDFLDSWNWHADERLDIVDPNRVSPELLGHIFEKTVNQKEMGAYYTPEEITHFMARNSIHPYIIDRINEEFDTNYEEIDEVFNLSEDEEDDEIYEHDETRIGELDGINREEVEHLYFEVLEDLKVLDPAVGSGAFLLAAQEVLLDVYLSCIEYFQTLDEEQKWDMTPQITKLVEKLEKGTQNESMHAKREIILQNLYGVDIDRGATEICKLRLWLSIVADLEEGEDPTEVDTLPNIDFNIRQGNSLIGFVEPLDRVLQDELDKGTQANLYQYDEGAVKEKYEDIISAVERHKNADSSSKAEKFRKEAEDKLEKYRDEPNNRILRHFQEAGIEDITQDDIQDYSPFHWILEYAEVYSSGGFDVIIGNPPWDRIKPNRENFFSKYDELFRTRNPDEKDEKQKELLQDKEIKSKWEERKKEVNILAKYFNQSDDYQLQKPEVGGKTLGTENDLSALFLERVYHLAKDDAYTSFILPGAIFSGASGKDLRLELLEDREAEYLIGFENHGIFQDIDNRYNFAVLNFKNSGNTEAVKGVFLQENLEILKNPDKNTLNLDSSLLKSFSPEARIFPNVQNEDDIGVIERITQFEPISQKEGNPWWADPYSELHRTSDLDRVTREKDEGDYPVLEGKNVYQFSYDNTIFSDITDISFWSVEPSKSQEDSAKTRIRQKNKRKVKRKLYQQFDGSGTQKSFVNSLLKEQRGKKLTLEDVKLDCSGYRIAYRTTGRATDERTMMATVLPKNYMCFNTLNTLRPFEVDASKDELKEEPLEKIYKPIFSEKELFYALGLINSLPFDYLIRLKVDSSIRMYKFEESQVPRLDENHPLFEVIWKNAAKLNCYGSEFGELREELDISEVTKLDERKKLQTELDAAVFMAYGLKESQVKYVLDNFHKVSNPKMLDDEYFDMVWEKYEELEEKEEVVAE